jgi:hypothetical protein
MDGACWNVVQANGMCETLRLRLLGGDGIEVVANER